jgi:hypothetical protein
MLGTDKSDAASLRAERRKTGGFQTDRFWCDWQYSGRYESFSA